MRPILTFLLIFTASLCFAQPGSPQEPKQGYVKKRGADNKIVYEGQFKDNKPVGKFIYYYPTDTIRAIMFFSDGGKTSHATLFHPNGKKMAKGKYKNKDVKDSTWLYYDEAGVLISQDNFKMGKKNGVCSIYFPDGKLSEEKTYKNDVLDGPYKEYYDGINLKSKGQYVNGKFEGRIVYYYPNQVEVAAGFYKSGEKNGPWIYKTESGKVREKELYKNGKLAGAKETEEFFANSKNQTEVTNKGGNSSQNKKK